jgi:hypothetical protein
MASWSAAGFDSFTENGSERGRRSAAPTSTAPLFRPLRPNGKRQNERRPMDPDAIDRVVRKFAAGLGLDRG